MKSNISTGYFMCRPYAKKIGRKRVVARAMFRDLGSAALPRLGYPLSSKPQKWRQPVTTLSFRYVILQLKANYPAPRSAISRCRLCTATAGPVSSTISYASTSLAEEPCEWTAESDKTWSGTASLCKWLHRRQGLEHHSDLAVGST